MSVQDKDSIDNLQATTNTIVLDYLLWVSAKTILQETSTAPNPSSRSSSARSKGQRLVGLVDGLISTLDQKKCPKFSYKLLTRRLDLASLVILFFYRDSQNHDLTRCSPESKLLRETKSADREARTARFLSARGMTNTLQAAGDSEDNAELVRKFKKIRVPADVIAQARRQFGSGGTDERGRDITLCDLLHQFILVSASAHAASGKSPEKLWTTMAMKFCLFAALEGYLVLGARGMKYLDVCFSYAASKTPDYGHADINALFSTRSPKHSQFTAAWERVRNQSLEWLRPQAGVSLEQNLLTVLRNLNYEGFKAEVRTHLSGVLESMPDPDLCKYPSALGEHILRAPGMISSAHSGGKEEEDEHEEETERVVKRAKVAT